MEGIARRRAQAREKFEKQSLADTKHTSNNNKAVTDVNGNTSVLRTTDKKLSDKEPKKPFESSKGKLLENPQLKTKQDKSSTETEKGRPKSLETRMLERKREREREQRKKTQEQQKNRNAFKQQLEENAPKQDPSQMCALKRGESNIDRLLRWVQKRVNNYPDVLVTDFSSSWANGMAFCALMHHLVPDKISMDGLEPSNRRKNFELAFKVASAEGIPELLDIEDMVRVSIPDKRSVVTYVHTIYKVMVIDKEQAKKDKEKDKDKE